jgi:hypothetical protein
MLVVAARAQYSTSSFGYSLQIWRESGLELINNFVDEEGEENCRKANTLLNRDVNGSSERKIPTHGMTAEGNVFFTMKTGLMTPTCDV